MVLNYKWKKGVKEVYPAHPMVQNWLFTGETEDEAFHGKADIIKTLIK